MEESKRLDEEWLESTTIPMMQEQMAAGCLSSRDLVMTYLDRIARYDKQGPRLNAVLEINPDAVAIAEALDHERVIKGPRGPLHGIPIMVKDNIDTGDKMHTSAGSLALANSYATEDSFVARCLREAGAVILGKTNMTEWANFMTQNMSNGYSSRGGQVLNPYGPGKYDVGGSSSGSGAAVAANLITVTIGTETSGSILSPASSNSVVGIKPTVGLISRTGIIPIMHSQDTAGPMAKSVTDAAVLLGALVGVDDRDPATYSSVKRAHTDYAGFLDATALRGKRIGIAREYWVRVDAERLTVLEQAVEELRQAGAIIIDPVTLPCSQEKFESSAMLLEFKPNLNAYLGRLGPHVPVHTLRELIAFNSADPEHRLKYGQTLLIAADQKSGTLTEPEYLKDRARDLYLSRDCGIDYALKEHTLDALLFPNNFGAGVAAKAGYPSITVPCGYTNEGRPVGLTFTAAAWSEPSLIGMAYAFEQATKHRLPPKLD